MSEQKQASCHPLPAKSDLLASLALFHRQRCSTFYAKADLPYPADFQTVGRIANPADEAGELQMVSDLCRRTLETKPENVSPLAESGTFHRLYRASLADGRSVIVRLHVLPGVRDFALHIDQWVMNRLQSEGLPVLRVFQVDVSRQLCPYDYEILEEARGQTLRGFDDDDNMLRPLLYRLGQVVAGIHQIKAEGFGLLDVRPLVLETGQPNKIHPSLPLRGRGVGGEGDASPSPSSQPLSPEYRGEGFDGCLDSWRDYIFLNLDRHLDQCAEMKAITSWEAETIFATFDSLSSVLDNVEPKLLHGDLGNHNIFTDGTAITAVIDWEDCLTGDPVFDIASWATFHPDRRHDAFLEGYREVQPLPDDFDLRFWLYFMRIALAKTVLRNRLGLTDKPGRAPASSRIQKGLHHLQSLSCAA